jgi:hypothetical protein
VTVIWRGAVVEALPLKTAIARGVEYIRRIWDTGERCVTVPVAFTIAPPSVEDTEWLPEPYGTSLTGHWTFRTNGEWVRLSSSQASVKELPLASIAKPLFNYAALEGLFASVTPLPELRTLLGWLTSRQLPDSSLDDGLKSKEIGEREIDEAFFCRAQSSMPNLPLRTVMSRLSRWTRAMGRRGW